ncbi:MAG TPA: ATP/GTP-binding protein [Cyclobacteriaceae bacterium]|nr:ATP/GTP-binding protein [Cyclobacteriaceae bacterium]
MKPLYACVVVLAVFAACSAPKETTTELKAPTLTMKWETEPTLTTCESVLYDKANDVLYVANIDGKPDSVDAVGSIGKVGLDGKVIDAQWVKGLNAPKGMGLSNGKLYVADINTIVEIDPSNGSITNKYVVDGAQFLNDITTDNNGNVFVSDSNTGIVSVLKDGKIETFLSGQTGPNGLLVDGDKFLMASFAQGMLYTVSQGQTTLMADSVENADGIEAVGDGGYLVSSWNGKVTYVSPDGRTKEILNTTADQVSAADIEYIAEKKLLLVPTFFKNKVVAYELGN